MMSYDIIFSFRLTQQTIYRTVVEAVVVELTEEFILYPLIFVRYVGLITFLLIDWKSFAIILTSLCI